MDILPHLPVLIGASALGLLILATAVWLCWASKRRRSAYIKLEAGILEYFSDCGKGNTDLRKLNDEDISRIELQFRLRSSKSFKYMSILSRIGRRQKKIYALVKMVKSDNTSFIGGRDVVVSMFPRAERGGIPLNKQTTELLRDFVLSLQHPFILPVLAMDIDMKKDRIYVFQPFAHAGSLKDYIHGSNPKHPYTEKYLHTTKRISSLSDKKIASFGRQILEALLFLEEHEIPYGHLTAANVILENGICRLTGIDNALFSLDPPPVYYHITPLLAKQHQYLQRDPRPLIHTLEFGHVLFEMATGTALKACFPETLPKHVSPKVTEALEFTFGGTLGSKQESSRQANGKLHQLHSRDALYVRDIPCIRQVAKCPFFAEVVLKKKIGNVNVQVQLSPSCRDLLQSINAKSPLFAQTIFAAKASPVLHPMRMASEKRDVGLGTSAKTIVPPPAPPPPPIGWTLKASWHEDETSPLLLDRKSEYGGVCGDD